jgi:hypothetical protein
VPDLLGQRFNILRKPRFIITSLVVHVSPLSC